MAGRQGGGGGGGGSSGVRKCAPQKSLPSRWGGRRQDILAAGLAASSPLASLPTVPRHKHRPAARRRGSALPRPPARVVPVGASWHLPAGPLPPPPVGSGGGSQRERAKFSHPTSPRRPCRAHRAFFQPTPRGVAREHHPQRMAWRAAPTAPSPAPLSGRCRRFPSHAATTHWTDLFTGQAPMGAQQPLKGRPPLQMQTGHACSRHNRPLVL